MKKIIILYILLIFGFSNAQYILWEDEFDGVNQTIPWSFYSLDNNPYTWATGKNWVMNASFTAMTDGDLDVLAWRSYTQAGAYVNNPPTEDWAVSPMIDLTGASGNITLAINFQDDLLTNIQILPVYISTTPDIDVIKNSTPFTTFNFSHPQFTVQFQELTADISSFAGQQIYLAFGKKKTSGNVANSSEIDYVTIVSDTSLATSDIKGKSANVTVYPNPVTDVLYLKNVQKANVAVYNAAGQRVLSKAVTNGQLNVSALQKGVYTLSVETNGKPSTTKFIKK
ncbi:MAG: hypothetical protein DI570_24710 [Phenylobacterium zucineum]|nr:MAG: hypothetical protein DI570_24710 [Phenylobacterium zucineum]